MNDRVERVKTFALIYHHQTELAIKFSTDGVSDHGMWFPKEPIDYEGKEDFVEDSSLSPGDAVDVLIPYRLAKEKGLI